MLIFVGQKFLRQDKDGYRSFRLLWRRTTGKKAVASMPDSRIHFTTSCFLSVSGPITCSCEKRGWGTWVLGASERVRLCVLRLWALALLRMKSASQAVIHFSVERSTEHGEKVFPEWSVRVLPKIKDTFPMDRRKYYLPMFMLLEPLWMFSISCQYFWKD